MATLLYQSPQMWLGAYADFPNPRKAQAASGHTGTAIIQACDFVTINTSGVLARAATGANANIYGLTNYGEQQIFGPYGGNAANSLQGVFGYSQAQTGGPLIPEDSIDIAVYPMLQDQVFEISLSNTTGWITGGAQQAYPGSTGGLLLDTTTNYYVFDPTQTNKVMTIYQKAIGPNIVLPSGVVIGKGQNGDTGGRVFAYFTSGVV